MMTVLVTAVIDYGFYSTSAQLSLGPMKGQALMAVSLVGIYIGFSLLLHTTAAGSVGVNYGRVANNLPSPQQTVQLLLSTSITKVKIFDADKRVLSALANSPLEVVMGFPNEQIRYAARKQSFAMKWVNSFVVPYATTVKITTISVGNEVVNSSEGIATQLVPAMKNIHTALVYYKLDQQVKLSSPLALSVLSSSYPPSAGTFKSDIASAVLKPMLDFISQTGSHVMVNAYPFFAYESNSEDIPLEYALFKPNGGVKDPTSGLMYYSLFDAQLDAVFSALTAMGYQDLNIVVSETGWPNNGDSNELGAGVSNAATYNTNLINHISSNVGTPLRPGASIDAFIFALFNENLKPGPGSERNYGLFYPNQHSVYDCGVLKGASKGQEIPAPSVRHNRHNSTQTPKKKKKETAAKNKAWCVVKSGMDGQSVQKGLDYACGEGNADCGAIQNGMPCFLPDTVEAHASYAFNSYYQKYYNAGGTCDFEGVATLTATNPSYATCLYP